MQITITCDSLQELKDTLEQLYVLFPEEEYLSESGQAKTGGGGQEEKPGPVRTRKKADKSEVIRMAKAGKTNKEIAKETGLAYSTVANIVRLNK